MEQKATTVLLVRHGETDWNGLHRMQGRSDIPLNARGRKQAGFAAEALADAPIDVIYTSPLRRARETAEIIRGKRKIPLFDESGLIEISLGRWEGLTPDQIDRIFPGKYDEWRSTPGEVYIAGGENFPQVQKRAVASYKRIVGENRGNTVLLVSHMGCLSTILLYVSGLPLDDMWKHPLVNCSVSEILVPPDGTAQVVKWNENSFIPEEYKLKKPFGRVK